MEISMLKKQIKDKAPQDFYIFAGDEWAIQRIYIDKIAQCKKLPVKYIDSISEIYGKLINTSFITQNFCYVIRDDKDLLSNDKLQEQILNGLLKQNILILVITRLDKRTKAFKVFADKYIAFDKMSVESLKKHVKTQIPLSDPKITKLIEICEQDYGRILLEIDKIKQYRNYKKVGDPTNYDDIFELLLEDGVIYVPPEDAVFDLVDAILKRQVKRTYWLLQECYDLGEINLVILSNLYNATKQLLQVQSCSGGVDIMETCGISYPQMQAALSRKNRYEIWELVNDLKLIREVEKNIKIGEIPDSIGVEYVLVNML